MKSRAVWLAVMLLAFVSCLGFAQTSGGSQILSAAGAKGGSSQGLSNLPPGAQSGVSAVVGHDTPGFAARPEVQGFLVTNPKDHLTASFTPGGVDVRSAGGSWRMTWLGYGYRNPSEGAGVVAPQSEANRVEYRRGAVTEWYVNGPLGIEQGFTVNTPPDSRESRQPLTLSMALSGDLKAAADGTGRGLTLSRNGGPTVLHYTGLTARDATGRDLRAWVEVQDARLLLKVDDSKARYPLVIDPWLQLAELTVTGSTKNDYVGFSVAISGNTLVVGAPLANVGANANQGALYVFTEPAGGWANMTQTATLTASNGQTLDELGWSVAISGNTIVAGAYRRGTFTGAAYVFVEPKQGWRTGHQTAELTASNTTEYWDFGYSVAIDGSTIVVSAVDGGQLGTPCEGAAYVYVEPTNGWATTSTFNAELTSTDESSESYFGNSVAISGNTILVGQPYAAIGSNQSQGAGYLYVEPTGGWATTSAYTAKLTASTGQTYDNLGYSVAINGNTAVLGAPGSSTEQGAAYVYVEPTGGWTTTTETAALTASDGGAGDAFGTSVAVSGNTVVVGAGSAFLNPNPLQGSAYVYVEPAGGWASTSTFTAKLTAGDGGPSAHFGRSVSIDSGTAVVGAYQGTNSGVFVGAAYVY